METLKIKKESVFIRSVIHEILERQKLAMPPGLDAILESYSAGVLTTLLSIKQLMHLVPMDGASANVLTEDTLNELIKELDIENEFNGINRIQ